MYFIKKSKLVLLSIVLLSMTLSASSPSYDCPINPEWVTNPSLPIDNKQDSFCDFYQLSTQVFLYLMSPNAAHDNKRNFEVQKNYPILENATVDSCDDTIMGDTLRISLDKTTLSTGQAGGNATIYDQKGNVVYYDVRFSRSTCSLEDNITNFPEGTTELKFAWKVLSNDDDRSQFITTEANISNHNVTLGLIGMHIAYATEKHPEFIWSTYEHKSNNPNCTPRDTSAAINFFFADSNCTSQLPKSMSGECKFNQPLDSQTSHTGTPTNICRVYPDGTADGDRDATENKAIIKQQNEGLVQLLSDSTTSESMKVLINYFQVGSLWLNDVNADSNITNQRGSLRLANTVAETSFQDVDLSHSFVSNCFGCHAYIGKKEITAKHNNIKAIGGLSHIYDEIHGK